MTAKTTYIRKKIHYAVIGSFVLFVLVCMFFYIQAFKEIGGMSRNSFVTYILIPSSLRNSTPPAMCSELYYSRYFIECGGICATQYTLTFSSYQGKIALENWARHLLTMPELKLDRYQLLDLGEYAEYCQSYRLILYDEYF